jgi:hypothetical protein
VSKSISEPVASASLPESPAAGGAARWPGWLKWIVLAFACLWLADTGISLLIRHTTMKRRLTARLEAAFGRPVDVRSYGFSLWTGPELEAYSVRVAEDPRFGNEYFLRAESVTLRVRWLSLLVGHLELGTISLSHPSLNLVRNADGDWNLAEWLPLPEKALSPGASAAARSAAPPFHKIEVNDGRINFKRGDEKLPFAFVGVNGTLETEGPGRWRLDLVAAPERAAVIVQDPGVLRLVGHLGGTSSRLRPATLEFDWSGASISDVLRLATDRDYGVRGTLGVSVAARTQGDSWILGGNALLWQLHRWDLPLRGDDPALSVVAHGRLDSSGSRLELTDAKIEMPHSNAAVTGALDWTHPGPARGLSEAGGGKSRRTLARTGSSNAATTGTGTELHIVSNAIALSDLLDWARAFHPGIADGIALGGFGRLDADLDGWPPRVAVAGFDLARGVMIGMDLPSIRFGSVAVHYDANRGIALAPATVVVGAPVNSFRVEGSAKPATGKFSLSVRGGTANVHDVVRAAGALDWNLARGWNIAGPVRCDLQWQNAAEPGQSTLAGSVDWGTAADGVSLGAPFLNRPVEEIRARADLKSGVTRVSLSSAEAFGANWTGTLEHELADGWKFSVSGDSLSGAELDRWLDPRWRESFLDRMLPFLNSSAPASDTLGSLSARGKLALDEFTLGPVAVHRLRGDLTLDGRHLELANAAGQFDRGRVAGTLQANFDSTPKYETTINFSGVDLETLSAEFPSLAGNFSGAASARIRFSLRGASRSDLLSSLECRGTSNVQQLAVNKIALINSAVNTAPSGAGDPNPSSFPEASAAFSCAEGKIQFQDLMLSGVRGRWNGAGSVDFARNLDLRLRLVSSESAAARPAKLTDEDKSEPRADIAAMEYRITGTLSSPRVVRESLPAHGRAEKR